MGAAAGGYPASNSTPETYVCQGWRTKPGNRRVPFPPCNIVQHAGLSYHQSFSFAIRELTNSPLDESYRTSSFEAWSSDMRCLNRCGAVLTALLLTATQADAQRRPGARARTARTLSAEQVLRSYERLELSAEQMTALEALQEDAIQRRRQGEDRLRELRSQLRGDEITRDFIREEVRGTAEATRQFVEAQQNRVREVLTEQQLDKVTRARRRSARGGGQSGRGVGRARFRGGRGGSSGARFRRPGSLQRNRRFMRRGFGRDPV